MAGRSCRRFGQSVARVYVMANYAPDMMEGAEDHLKRALVTASMSDGAHIAKVLFKKWESVTNAAIKKDIAEALNTPAKWRTTIKSFQTTKPYLWKWLSVDSFKATSSTYKI